MQSLLPFLDTAGGSSQFVTAWGGEEGGGECSYCPLPFTPSLQADLSVEAHCTCPEEYSQQEEEERSEATQEEPERRPFWPFPVPDLGQHVDDEVQPQVGDEDDQKIASKVRRTDSNAVHSTV